MEISVFENVLSIVLPERMSIDNAEDCTRIIDDALREHPGCSLRFDAEKLTYISSMGLRVLLHSIKKTEGRIPIENVSHDVYSIFQTTGFTSLMDVRLRPRDLSVEGCELIGSGRSSHVYRLDSETIIKCYEPTIPLNRIRHEMDLARNSFIKGIPTAIPMELVRVGDRYGAVFELIDADTVGHHVSEHPEDFEIVQSNGSAIMQHDPLTWQISGPDFIHEEDFTSESKFFYTTFNEWVKKISIDQRKIIVATLFDIIEASGCTSNKELVKNRIHASAKMIEAYAKLNRERKNDIHKIVRVLRQAVHDSLPMLSLINVNQK